MGFIPGSGRSPGEGNGNPFQYSCLENPMARGAWPATVHMVTKSQTQLKQLNTHTPLERERNALFFLGLFVYNFQRKSPTVSLNLNAKNLLIAISMKSILGLPSLCSGHPLHQILLLRPSIRSRSYKHACFMGQAQSQITSLYPDHGWQICQCPLDT